MPPQYIPFTTIGLLLLSNVFMTFAWYGHLKYKAAPLYLVVLISWGIAFFEYCFMIPANRMGIRTAPRRSASRARPHGSAISRVRTADPWRC